MKRVFLTIVNIILVLHLSANDRGKIELDFDLQTRHYWRGMQMGNTPAIEPGITYSIKGFSFNIWAAKTFNKSYSEIDLIPSYTIKNYTFTLFNYYNPVSGEENRYFDFSDEKCRHSVELAFNYNGQGKIPLKIFSGTFLMGDKNPLTHNPLYSTHCELGFPFRIKNILAEIHTGFTPFKGYYAPKAALISTGIAFQHNFSLSEKLDFPFRFSLLANPYTSNAFVIFGVGLSIK